MAIGSGDSLSGADEPELPELEEDEAAAARRFFRRTLSGAVREARRLGSDVRLGTAAPETE